MSFKDAVLGLAEKIRTSTEGANPEQIAYLATAADRIGGKASIFDFIEMADEKQDEFIAIVEAAKVAATTAINDNQTARLLEITTEMEETLAAMETTKTQAQAAIVNTANTAQTNINNTRTAAETAITAKKDEALAAATAAAEAVLANGFGQRGRLAFYTTF